MVSCLKMWSINVVVEIDLYRLFVVEGVVGGVGVALAGWGRGLPMMGVVTLPIWKTPTWTTLPSTVLI